MRKIGLTLLCVLIASTAFAGGSIFGGHKHKTVNTNGVYAIGVHICSSLECPPIRIVEGKCDGENMSKHWGVCVCEAGYMPKDGSCEACPEGQYSDGINACQDCPQGQYIAHDGDTQCSDCPSEHYCKGGQAIECPDHAICSDTGFECDEEYVLKDNTCVLPSGRLLEYDGDEDACLWYTYKDEKCYDEESITESDCESIYHARWCEWRNGSHFCSLSNNCCLKNGAMMLLVSGAVECSSKICDDSTDYRWVDQIKPDGTKCGLMPNPGGFCIDGQCVTEINETDCATYDGTWCEWYDGSNFCSLTGNCCVKDGAMMTVPAEEECSSKVCNDSTGYRWVLQAKQDGIACENGVCQAGECICPANANCDVTPWVCTGNTYRTGGTCATCLDPNALTCDGDGKSTSCKTDYLLDEVNGICYKNLCKDVVLNQCQESCDPKTGNVIDRVDVLCDIADVANGGYCNAGICVNPCETMPVGCAACVPFNGVAICTTCADGYGPKDGACVACPTYKCNGECCTMTGAKDFCGHFTPDYGFKDEDGNCHKCADVAIDPVYVGWGVDRVTCVTKCEGVKNFGPYCALKDCGSGYIQQELKGTCISCDISGNVLVMVSPGNTCSVCPGWVYVNGGYCANSQEIKDCYEANGGNCDLQYSIAN